MDKPSNGRFVIAHSTLDEMTVTGYYAPRGKITDNKRLALKFTNLPDTLNYIETHNIILDEKSFITYVLVRDVGRK